MVKLVSRTGHNSRESHETRASAVVYAVRVDLSMTKHQGLLCQASCRLDVTVCGYRFQVSVV